MKDTLNRIEALIVRLMLLIFGAMSFDKASNIGSFLGRKIGPYTRAHTIARKNIKLAMPELSDERVDEILVGMWDNLGRVFTEYGHMAKITATTITDLVEIDNWEQLGKLTINEGGFLITGHFGNWEMSAATTHFKGANTHIVYRKANNPYVDEIICKIRKRYQTDSSAKGTVGARKIIQSIQRGLNIAMLVDQKQNDGISVPLFGVPAMTAPAIATLALKYNCKIFPARIVRVNNTRFKFVMSPEIIVKKTGNDAQDKLELMTEINLMLEKWIREYPEQWFWVHNRWPKNR